MKIKLRPITVDIKHIIQQRKINKNTKRINALEKEKKEEPKNERQT